MSWQPEVDDICRRTELARAYGGAESVERARAAGKGLPRERIEALLDPGSFREIGALTGKPSFDDDGALTGVTPSNSIIGKGRIEGRRIVVSADDFTVRGGSSESAISDKWIHAERQALDLGVPLLRLVETAGGSVNLLVQSGGTKLPGYASWPLFDLLREVPVVGIALGACAGLGAVKVAASHFSVMVKGTSQVFAAGPPVVRDGLGLEIDKESLGGAAVHARGSGVVDNEAKSEEDAFQQARRFLSYLPRNVRHLPPVAETDDDPGRRDDWLLEAVPRETRRVYDTRKILAAVADAGSLFEIGRYWGRSSVTTLARFGGRPVGILANDPRYFGGAMTVQSSQKIARFVRLCDAFNLPVVSLFDQPGVMIGPDAEKAGTITAALDALTAIDRARVPWCAVVLRRAFGVAGSAYGPLGRSITRVAWPSAQWGSIPLEGGIAAAYRRELEAHPDPEARLKELEAQFRNLTSPFRTAEKFGIDDIIDPRETRPFLCEWTEDAYESLADRVAGTRERAG